MDNGMKKKPERKRTRKSLVHSSYRIEKNKMLFISAMIAMLIITVFCCFGTISASAEAFSESYGSAYEIQKQNAYEERYNMYFEKAEKRSHVANRAVISFSNMREIAELEVLKVKDTEYVIEDKNNNDNSITAWMQVEGEAVFTVNLETAEYIVDVARNHVTVRLNYPEFKFIEDLKPEKLLFKDDDIFNDSYKVGDELADVQIKKGEMLISKEITSNEYYYKSAENAARSIIVCMVKQFNTDIPELEVEVEFY